MWVGGGKNPVKPTGESDARRVWNKLFSSYLCSRLSNFYVQVVSITRYIFQLLVLHSRSSCSERDIGWGIKTFLTRTPLTQTRVWVSQLRQLYYSQPSCCLTPQKLILRLSSTGQKVNLSSRSAAEIKKKQTMMLLLLAILSSADL